MLVTFVFDYGIENSFTYMYCLDPQIIVSKKLHVPLSRFGNRLYFTDGITTRKLDGRIPSPKSVGATKDNYKNWCILTPDGECIPCFILVPCNHCVLCRDKKAKAWSTRATCETEAATYPPLFVTLTYEDKYLPLDGVCKEHVQKFLKRFRINWYREFETKLDLRYFAVAEYGRKYGRPHYHLILWNVPNNRDADIKQLDTIYRHINLAWSESVSLEEYASLPPYLRIGDNRRSFGRIEVTPDRGNSAGYCMKYMRKDCPLPSDDVNPTFHLSSRRGGGIGSRYLDKHFDEFRKNYRLTTVPVGDNNYALPRIFKDKLFPTLSTLLPSSVRCNIERFHELVKFISKHYQFDDEVIELITSLRSAVKSRYGQLYDDIVFSKELYQKDNLFPLPKRPRYADLEYLYRNAVAIYRQLYAYQPNIKAITDLLAHCSKRAAYLEVVSSSMPEIDVDGIAYNIRYNNRLSTYRESF